MQGGFPMATNYHVVPVRRTNVGLIVLVCVCCVVGLGFYLGWFTLTERHEATSNNVNLKVDSDKIKHDVQSATEKTEQKASQLSNKVKQEAHDLKSRTAGA
jgi:cytoskeletal protein RodZ